MILETDAVEEGERLVQIKLMQHFLSKILVRARVIMYDYNIIRNIVIAHEFTVMRLTGEDQ